MASYLLRFLPVEDVHVLRNKFGKLLFGEVALAWLSAVISALSYELTTKGSGRNVVLEQRTCFSGSKKKFGA